MRRALLTAHIICSVALLGDVAGFLAIAIRAATTDDPALAASSYELLEMFSVLFGIPLSFGALLTGLALTRVTKWGVRHDLWVTVSLGVIVSVILVGSFVLGPSVAAKEETPVIVGSAYDVLALSLATGLSVYKPRLKVKR